MPTRILSPRPDGATPAVSLTPAQQRLADDPEYQRQAADAQMAAFDARLRTLPARDAVRERLALSRSTREWMRLLAPPDPPMPAAAAMPTRPRSGRQSRTARRWPAKHAGSSDAGDDPPGDPAARAEAFAEAWASIETPRVGWRPPSLPGFQVFRRVTWHDADGHVVAMDLRGVRYQAPDAPALPALAVTA